MANIRDQQTRTEPKARLVEQLNISLQSGDYSRALELLRDKASDISNDTELSELERLARDGSRRNADANRLITESQDLFAQRNSAEAIQLLRQAYDLDKNNSLARSILANACSISPWTESPVSCRCQPTQPVPSYAIVSLTVRGPGAAS